MKDSRIDRILAYLSGDLTHPEREHFEEECARDPGLREQVLEVRSLSVQPELGVEARVAVAGFLSEILRTTASEPHEPYFSGRGHLPAARLAAAPPSSTEAIFTLRDGGLEAELYDEGAKGYGLALRAPGEAVREITAANSDLADVGALFRVALELGGDRESVLALVAADRMRLDSGRVVLEGVGLLERPGGASTESGIDLELGLLVIADLSAVSIDEVDRALAGLEALGVPDDRRGARTLRRARDLLRADEKIIPLRGRIEDTRGPASSAARTSRSQVELAHGGGSVHDLVSEDGKIAARLERLSSAADDRSAPVELSVAVERDACRDPLLGGDDDIAFYLAEYELSSLDGRVAEKGYVGLHAVPGVAGRARGKLRLDRVTRESWSGPAELSIAPAVWRKLVRDGGAARDELATRLEASRARAVGASRDAIEAILAAIRSWEA